MLWITGFKAHVINSLWHLIMESFYSCYTPNTCDFYVYLPRVHYTVFSKSGKLFTTQVSSLNSTCWNLSKAKLWLVKLFIQILRKEDTGEASRKKLKEKHKCRPALAYLKTCLVPSWLNICSTKIVSQYFFPKRKPQLEHASLP